MTIGPACIGRLIARFILGITHPQPTQLDRWANGEPDMGGTSGRR